MRLITYQSKIKIIGFAIAVQFLFIFAALVNKSFFTQKTEHKSAIAKKEVFTLPNIYDRNGYLLAFNIPTKSVYADPTKILDLKKAAISLNKMFPGLLQEQLQKKLKTQKSFVWIKRHITPEQYSDFLYQGIPGLYVKDEQKRIYITEDLFSHVVGYTDDDGKGIAGLEHYLYKNSILKNVFLTLDTRVQYVLRQEMQETVKRYNAKGAAGVILDAQSGQIIAMVSLPDFDPNHQSFTTKEQKFNRASLGVYELGSVMKVFTFAAALDSGAIFVDDVLDVSSNIKIDKYTIKDFHPPKKPLYTAKETMLYSSNIGLAKIALKCGAEKQMEYFEKLGLLDKLVLEIPEKGRVIKPRDKKDLTTITISYGYGASVTLVHLVQAFATIVSKDGCAKRAKMISDSFLQNKVDCKSIVKDQTRKSFLELTEEIVKKGTGKRARAKGYRIGGKTGTGEKIKNGVYSKKLNVSTFVGAFPINQPQYVIAIMLDEPKSQTSATGGVVAAPAVKNVVEKIAPILKIQPSL